MSRHKRVVFRTAVALLAAVGVAPQPASAQTVEQNDSSAKAARRSNSLPLIPTRTLEFTTDEGTWISLDLTPDGETILFELLGLALTLGSYALVYKHFRLFTVDVKNHVYFTCKCIRWRTSH